MFFILTRINQQISAKPTQTRILFQSFQQQIQSVAESPATIIESLIPDSRYASPSVLNSCGKTPEKTTSVDLSPSNLPYKRFSVKRQDFRCNPLYFHQDCDSNFLVNIVFPTKSKENICDLMNNSVWSIIAITNNHDWVRFGKIYEVAPEEN